MKSSSSTKAKGTAKGSPHAKPKKKVPKIKPTVEDDLAQAIVGKTGVVEVLRASSEDVIGFVDEVLVTGMAAVDRATGIGGLPYGRLIEVSGKEQVGKTTFCEHVISAAQKKGDTAGLVDSEHKWDMKYARLVGVDDGKLLLVQGKQQEGTKEDAGLNKKDYKTITVQEMVGVVDRSLDWWLLRNDRKGHLVLVIDSVAGMPTDEEWENPTDSQPGIAARALRKALRVLSDKIARAKALIVVVNQVYAKIGFTGHGPKSTTYGGGGIRYHASFRFELVRTGFLKAGEFVVGHTGIVRTQKTSLGQARDEAYAIAAYRGFDNAWTILEKLTEHGHVKSAGGWYEFNAADGFKLRWQGGFAQLDALMREDDATPAPTLRKRLTDLYMSIP